MTNTESWGRAFAEIFLQTTIIMGLIIGGALLVSHPYWACVPVGLGICSLLLWGFLQERDGRNASS